MRFFVLVVLVMIFVVYSFQGAFAEEKISVDIITVEPIRADHWTISWDACSLVEKIGQDFKISSDLEWESFHVDFILYKDQCIVGILGHPIISVIDAKDPDSISITLDEPTSATNEQKIIITDILSTKIKGKYVAFFDVCAGEKRLIGPEIIVYSDIDERKAPVGSVIGINSCFGHSAEIYAESIDSIKVDFAENSKVTDDKSLSEVADMQTKIDEQDQEIKELKEEVTALKGIIEEKDEAIAKKDAILMEQVKVLKDLADRISNTIHDEFAKVFKF